MSGPTYDPKSTSFPKPVIAMIPQPLPRRDHRMAAICRPGECRLPIRRKDEIGKPNTSPCPGRCRLEAQDTPDPVLPKPPSL